MSPTYKELTRLHPHLSGKGESEIRELLRVIQSCGYEWDEERTAFHHPSLGISFRAGGLDLFTPDEFMRHHEKQVSSAKAGTAPAARPGGTSWAWNAIRWLLLIPAAFLAGTLAGGIVRALSLFEPGGDRMIVRWANEATASAVAGVAFVYAVWKVAPQRKHLAVKLLGSLFGLLVIVPSVLRPNEVVWSLIMVAAGIVTARCLFETRQP